MRPLLLLFVFTFSVTTLHAKPGPIRLFSFHKTPIQKYKKAKRKNRLGTLTVQERILILHAVKAEVREDSLDEHRHRRKERNEIVRNVITTTPRENVRQLFDSIGTDLAGFRSQFDFLSFEHMSFILNYTKPVLLKKEKDSEVFKIPYDLFQEQLRMNTARKGDNLFQSHFTDFCGKVALTRLWIRYDSAGYCRFMTELYYNGRANWNGRPFETPREVIDAINNDRISEDPNQNVYFRNPEVSEKMPEMMDMVLYLTLASSFHMMPFTNTKYDPEKHMENTAWAGATVSSQIDMLQAIGFRVKKVGDIIRKVSDDEFDQIKKAGSRNSNRNVMLLVNSSMLNILSGAGDECNRPAKIEHKMVGTHWITVDFIDEKENKFAFWEYGKHREIKGLARMQDIIAGGIIIEGYEPKN